MILSDKRKICKKNRTQSHVLEAMHMVHIGDDNNNEPVKMKIINELSQNPSFSTLWNSLTKAHYKQASR
jgi:hypothetical protein